jgi:S-adenosylmethionine hydrolase
MVGGAGDIHSIENPDVMIEGPGSTFAGRDIFAPAAALLASGEATLADLGPPLDPGQVLPLMLPLPKVEQSTVHGEVLWVDWYGNVQTNVGPEEMAEIGVQPGESVGVRVGASSHVGRFVTTFGDVAMGEVAIHLDSAGLIAVAVRGGRASDELSLAAGRPLSLRRT